MSDTMQPAPAELGAISVQDACRYLAVGRTSVYELLNAGELRGFKIGSRRLVSRQSLNDFIDRKVKMAANASA